MENSSRFEKSSRLFHLRREGLRLRADLAAGLARLSLGLVEERAARVFAGSLATTRS